jgi:ribosomal protein L11 methyltransferase
MKPQALWEISVHSDSSGEVEVVNFLETRFGQPAAAYTDAESGQTTVSAYCRKKPRLSKAEWAKVHSTVARICGAPRPRKRMVSLRRLRATDWAESWKRHFPPLVIGGKLLIKPSWSRRRPRRGQSIVVLDPGLSFGTGQHATTGYCLRELVYRRKAGEEQSFLDIGTGSGILAIAAAKLGYAPVDAFDFDAQAVRTAQANARRNRVKLRIVQRDLTRLPLHSARRYHIVCANLISNLLLSERERILNRLRPGGVLVLAGILKREFAEVQLAYTRAGLRLIASRIEREWRAGTFARRH